MWRRGKFGRRRRNVGRITQYFQTQKSARRPFNSCPNPTFDTGYSSEGSNSRNCTIFSLFVELDRRFAPDLFCTCL
ncbi:hypothetical protein TIFTF001_039271, partial [Ficus carica]